MLNSVKHVGAQKKSRIVGEVGSEGGRIWRDYCTTIAATLGALEKWLFKTCVAVYSRFYCNVINKLSLCISSGCHL